jgi:hypothetical protein
MQWEKVRFLIENGFVFQRVRERDGRIAPYPRTLKAAQTFVIRYRAQAWFPAEPPAVDGTSHL